MFRKNVFGTMAFIIGIVLLVSFVFAFTSCGNSSNDKSLVGRWRHDRYGFVIELSKDGKLIIEDEDDIGTWSTAKGRLTFRIDDDELSSDYSVDGSKLNFYEGDTDDDFDGTWTKLGN